jgi:hypothetical protein
LLSFTTRGSIACMSRQTPPMPPSLEQMRRSAPWLWVHCANSQCRHIAPMAITRLIIRWGAGVSSDRLRQSARCSRCNRKGATLQHPGWGGGEIGWLPFPVER